MPASQSDPVQACAGVAEAELQELLRLVAGTEVAELEVVFDGGHVRLRRDVRDVQVAVAESANEPRAGATPPVASSPLLAITSPLVGTFHLVVSEGDELQAGTPLGSIESLGMPTAVDAPEAGVVEEVLVADGGPVEYGQPLLVLRRAETLADA
jgi:biotin carboxyl carrier protein